MPNCCSNRLKVRMGKNTKIALKQFNEFGLTYDNVVKTETLFGIEFPCPQELRDTQSSPGTTDVKLKKLYLENTQKYGYPDWYKWSVAHWGVKWEARDIDQEGDSENIVFNFNTAWGAPEKWLEEVSKKYPKLEFHNEFSIEGGMGCGILSYQNGEGNLDIVKNKG